MPGEIHPFVLHFAVGLLLTAPAADILGLLLRREPLLHTGRWTTIIGAVASVATLLSGIGAQAVLGPHSAAGEALLNVHNALGWVTVAFWVPLAVWRIAVRQPMPLRLRTIYLALSLTGAIVVFSETVLGSAIVYRHGVGLSAGARAEPAAPAAPGRVKVEKRP